MVPGHACLILHLFVQERKNERGSKQNGLVRVLARVSFGTIVCAVPLFRLATLGL